MGIRRFLRAKADDIAAAGGEILRASHIEVVDRGRTMWDDDGSGDFLLCVGLFHEYDIVSVEVRHVFGIWWLPYRHKTPLVSFGGHEFFGHGRLRETWCVIHDRRFNDVARRTVGPLGGRYDPVAFTVTASPTPP